MNKLIIVESPTKARTISRFVGSDFQILATMGHIRDLPKSKFGVEIKKKNSHFEFIPQYLTDRKKSRVIKELKQALKRASQVYLATDPDREGEAIAWHVIAIATINPKSKIQNPKNDKLKIANEKFYRISFHEITKEAIQEALENPGQINMNLVNAQQARRILDRLVGYSLSPLLWKKIRKGLSAGRVQSVAVRLIVEREREIEKFKSQPYFRLWVFIDSTKPNFVAQLVKIGNQPVEIKEKHQLFAGQHLVTKTIFSNQSQAEEIILNLPKNFKLQIANVKSKEIFRWPLPPFTTATLQQEASRRFGWSARQTMRVAQSLFEKGFITYHRTDSVALATPAVFAIRKLIEKEYGQKYLPEKPISYKTKSKLAQEAHEAIRPTNLSAKVKAQKSKLDNKEKRLFELIWQRAVACQMAPAKLAQTKIELKAGQYLFAANGSQVLFDGFTKIYPLQLSETILPQLKEGQTLTATSFGLTKHQTQPPPRYNEATLIAALEKHGIGRPSTYAPIISTIQKRLYVEKKQKRFFPTTIGIATNDFLVQYFPDIVDLPFTAKMEDSLDEIAQGKKDWQPILSDFWGPFSTELEKVSQNAQRVKLPVEKTGEKCPKCQKGELIIRTGKFGKFIACSRFPDCDYTAPYHEKADFPCPKCGAEVVIKTTKKGARFYSCSRWPDCSWSSWRKP